MEKTRPAVAVASTLGSVDYLTPDLLDAVDPLRTLRLYVTYDVLRHLEGVKACGGLRKFTGGSERQFVVGPRCSGRPCWFSSRKATKASVVTSGGILTETAQGFANQLLEPLGASVTVFPVPVPPRQEAEDASSDSVLKSQVSAPQENTTAAIPRKLLPFWTWTAEALTLASKEASQNPSVAVAIPYSHALLENFTAYIDGQEGPRTSTVYFLSPNELEEFWGSTAKPAENLRGHNVNVVVNAGQTIPALFRAVCHPSNPLVITECAAYYAARSLAINIPIPGDTDVAAVSPDLSGLDGLLGEEQFEAVSDAPGPGEEPVMKRVSDIAAGAPEAPGPRPSSLSSPPSEAQPPLLYMESSAFALSREPMSAACSGPCCKRPRAYIRHLLAVHELTGQALLTAHNLCWVRRLVEAAGRMSADEKAQFCKAALEGMHF